MNYCTNCGNTLNQNDAFCIECGNAVNKVKYCGNCGKEISSSSDICKYCGLGRKTNTHVSDGKAIAIVSVVFGSLGFYPLPFIGSIVGFILAVIGLNNPNCEYRGRLKIGFWLSISSFILWILFAILIGYGLSKYPYSPYPY